MNIMITALPVLAMDVYEELGKVHPGGEALNFAVHASEFTGIDISLIGAVGNDDYGRQILDNIGYRRINTEGVKIEKKGATAVCRTYLTPEGERYYKDDSWQGNVLDKFKLSKSDIKQLSLADLVYINSYSACFDEVVALKRNSAFKLAVDFSTRYDEMMLEELCPDIDFVMCSGKESDLPVFLHLSKKYPAVVFNITLAKEGSVTYQEGKEYRVPATLPDEFVDTTGCGDSYHAGFLCSYLKEGEIMKAMKTASDLASVTIEHLGGF